MSIHTTSNKKSNPTIIAIETSCDDTSVAVWKDGKILANITAQQHIHKIYGGVVPELASRDHEKSIAITFKAAMKKSDINPKEVDAIAFTQGPGLLGALMVGTSFAKSLAMVWKKPLIAINHLHAHIAALYINNPKPQFPFLCLLVSGGHTQIILVKNYFDYQIVGQTLDDAAGEAFDKIGKLLGLNYPAGPIIDKNAKLGNAKAFPFTQANVANLDYSFSGFKTQVLYFLQKEMKKDALFIQNNMNDLCASIQHNIVNYLCAQVNKAIKLHPIKGISIVGGVSANSALRDAFKNLANQHQLTFMVPEFEYCTDNAGMIASAAYQKFLLNDFSDLSVKAMARF